MPEQQRLLNRMADDLRSGTVGERQDQLFSGVVFTIIPGEALDEGNADSLIDQLDSNGAQFIPLRPDDGRVDELRQHTHIISTHVDFPDYPRAIDIGVNVVTPKWVTHSIRKSRQAQPRQHSPDPSQYFRDVVLTCANLPEGDKDAILAGVMALGGQYSGPLTKLVTHIVTMDLDNDKCQLAQQMKLQCRTVLPHWFDDCLRLGKKINEAPYTFPNPEILQLGNDSPIKIRPSPHVEGASSAIVTSAPPYTPPSSPSDQRKQLNVFMAKKIKFSDDLRISEHLAKQFIDLVEYGGGSVVKSVEDADTYIGNYREGPDYVAASRAGKEVANLSWFYNVLNRNTWANPLNKLLHYPVPRKGLPGFEHLKISLSNYTGESRIYLENLVKHCGAEFTKTMKQDNTHLITAHKQSEKCDAAQEWNINIINHIWLEESYAKCAVQTLTNPRHTHFPSRTNLGEVVGSTSFDMKRVEAVYFPKTMTVASTQKSPAKQKQSPRKGVPVIPASSALTSGTSLVSRENEQIRSAPSPVPEDQEPRTVKKPRGRPSKSAQTPSARLLDEEKENETPSTTGSGRASKVAAMSALHKQADDIALYQKEMKRKGGVTHGGRRSSILEDFSSPAPVTRKGRKRPSDEATYEDEGDTTVLSEDEVAATKQGPRQAKRTKQAAAPVDLPAIQWKMMVSGDERWLNNTKKESEDRNKLRQLGIHLTQNPQEVTMLCAPRILRTKKFVCALASAPTIVDSKFLDTTLKHNKIPDPEKYPLRDRDSEERLGFKLAESVERASDNNRKLLRGWSIFVTKDVNGIFDTYKDIITLNGGTAFMYQGRTGVTLPKRRVRDDPEAGAESQHQGGDEEFDYVYLISGTEASEVKLWKTFRDLAAKQGLEARIVKTDWLLSAAMRQRIEWDEKWQLSENMVQSQRQG